MSISASVIRETRTGARECSLSSIHGTNGDIFISEPIDPETATRFTQLMLYLRSEEKPVNIYINCPGGEVTSGLLMYDVMRSYPYGVSTFCTGFSASMGALLLAAGDKGRRYILPHSKVMIHEPLIQGGVSGSASSVEKTARSVLETKRILNEILAERTGKSVEEINEATRFDNFMDANEAVEFGICDEITSL